MATEQTARQDVVDACRAMSASGLSHGTSGNVSVRFEDQMLISPSATPYDKMTPDMVACVDLSDEMPDTWHGPKKPSTEWRFHWAAMRQRPEVTAVVHAHPPYCTALSMLRKPIPACHYMVAIFGGMDVRVADYHTFGTSQLADNVTRALEGRSACLMANHGMVVTGTGIEQAMWRAGELEALAQQYHLALTLGEPHILSEDEMEGTFAMIAGYGVQDD